MRFPCIKQVAWCLVLVMTLFGFIPKVEAAISPSKVFSMEERSADLGKIQATLENKMVKERLESLGYSTNDIQQKLSKLDDSDLHSLAMRLDQANVGGVDAVGFIVALGIIVLIVVAILYFTNKKVTVQQK